MSTTHGNLLRVAVLQIFVFLPITLAFTGSTTAQVHYNATYDASTGTFPDAACPPWTVTDTATPEDPVVQDGVLTLSTSTGSENMIFRQVGTNVFIPPSLVIEFRAKFISGSSNSPARSPMGVSVTTAPSVGSSCYIEHGSIFLTSGELIRGPSATVLTDDDFHTYRIEIIGSVVDVFYDDIHKLSGSTYTSANDFGPTPRIIFGDGASGAYGTSQWQYLRHNAGAIPCGATVFTSVYDPAQGLFPDQLCPPWCLIDTYDAADPVITDGKLVIDTNNPVTRMFYLQTNLQIPDPIVVEFRAKLISGTSEVPARGPLGLAITIRPLVGVLFYIKQGEIFLAAGHGTDGSLIKGPAAAAPTADTFHTYSVEVYASGEVWVYQDGIRLLVGSTYEDLLDNSETPRIYFGEGSFGVEGVSEWEFVRHNAGVPSSGAPTPFSLVVPADGDTVPTGDVFLDWTNSVDPDCAGPVLYYVDVDSTLSFTVPTRVGPLTSSQSTVSVQFLPGRSYFWRVHAIDASGDSTLGAPGFARFVTYPAATAVAGGGNGPLDGVYGMHRAYPNPFNPQTTVRYSLPKPGHVTLAIYDLRGARVATLVDEDLLAGEQSVEWRGVDDRGAAVPSGLYFARL